MANHEETLARAYNQRDDSAFDRAMQGLVEERDRARGEVFVLYKTLELFLPQVKELSETVCGVSCRFCKSNLATSFVSDVRHTKDCPWVAAKKLVARYQAG